MFKVGDKVIRKPFMYKGQYDARFLNLPVVVTKVSQTGDYIKVDHTYTYWLSKNFMLYHARKNHLPCWF